MGKLAGAAWIVGCVVVVGGFYLKDQIEKGDRRYEAAKLHEEAAQNGVHVRAAWAKDCPSERPIEITVKNTSDRTLKRFRFHLGIYADGQSSDFNYGGTDTWPYVVSPGEEVETCWGAPDLPKGRYFLRIERDIRIDPAEFYGPGEFIPRAASPPASASAQTAAQPPRGARPASAPAP